MREIEGKYNFDVGPNLIEDLIEIVVSHIEVDKIVLFGSRARGDNKYNSDIDIAIQTREDLAKVKSLLEEDLKTLLKLNVVDYNKIEGEFKQEIDTDGIVIYEKTEPDRK